ncbi:MAG: Imm45 family immunity protein [Marinomonas colpomeniae]
MKWIPIKIYDDESFGSGVVFRFSAKHPFEDIVDWMLIEDFDAESRYKLICATGYHAGKTELILPIEARHEKGGISKNWVINNWNKWIYPDCSVDNVKCIESYIAPF